MSNAVIYDETGRIHRTVTAPADMLILQKQPGEFILFSEESTENKYVHQGELVPRQPQLTTVNKVNLLADGVDTVSIQNTPFNCELTVKNLISGEIMETTINGSDTFSTTIPGTIELIVRKWPYLDYRVLLEAV